MRIAIEITPLLAAREQYGDKSGVYQITYNFLKELIRIDKKDEITLFDYPGFYNDTVNIEIFNLLQKNVKVFSFDIERTQAKLSHGVKDYKYKKMLPLMVKKVFGKIYNVIYSDLEDITQRLRLRTLLKQYDLVHSSETVYLYASKAKNVITINDLVAFLFPKFQPSETVDLHLRKLAFAKNKADKIIAISQNTKNDLVKHLEILPEKIEVVYPAAGEEFKPINDLTKVQKVLAKYKLEPNKYFLYVGTTEPRKNLITLVKAFSRICLEGAVDKKLILIGGEGWGGTREHLEKMIKGYKLEHKVQILGFVPQDYLPYFYNGAFAFIFPSFYEGFGVTILEAMQCGTPVICSDKSSLPEAAGKAALSINPRDINSIIKAINKINESDELRNKLREAGFKQAAKFSWEKNAQQVLSIYKSLYRQPQIRE